MNAKVLAIVCGLVLSVTQASALLETNECTRAVCTHRKGHYKFTTSQRTLQALAFGRDIRTKYVTKDYRTRFDVVFLVKNLKNYDVRFTQFGLGAYTVGTSKPKSATVTSSNDKIVYFKDVTSVQLSLASYQEKAEFDVYYYMDCGFDADQHLSLKYPEPAQSANIVLKTWDKFFQADWGREERKRTCWFLVPFDRYDGWGDILSTYVIIQNASLVDGSKINIVDVVTNKSVTSFPDPSLSSEVDISHAPGRVKSTDVGFSSTSATTILYVELSCPRRYQKICKAKTNFQILIKPFIKDDLICIKIEDKCRFGSGGCGDEEEPEEGADLSIGGEAFRTSKCPALADLLETYNKALPPQQTATERMGMRAMCSELDVYCSDIRVCSSQGRCAEICLNTHMRGICANF